MPPKPSSADGGLGGDGEEAGVDRRADDEAVDLARQRALAAGVVGGDLRHDARRGDDQPRRRRARAAGPPGAVVAQRGERPGVVPAGDESSGAGGGGELGGEVGDLEDRGGAA